MSTKVNKDAFERKHSRNNQIYHKGETLINGIPRREFLYNLGLVSVSVMLSNNRISSLASATTLVPVSFEKSINNEDLFSYIRRVSGRFDLRLYKQLVGAANEFKEGDDIAGIAAPDEITRKMARNLISNTSLINVYKHPLFQDEQYELIQNSTVFDSKVMNMTFGELKIFLLESDQSEIKQIMPSLSSDIIAFVVKLMNNDELISISKKVFNPLPNSNIGAKGYVSARVQPNSPTDNIEDIIWQVFDAWSYGVGDLVLGTNPVSSDPAMVSRIEAALHDLLFTFQLEDIMPNCVLSHIDIQADVEELQPGTTGVWFQSLAGTVKANQTFDVTIEKMQAHADARRGKRYGLYAETGQGADATNGHSEGFDMVVHESRKYGLLRALKQRIYEQKNDHTEPWVFLNDVAGFIGPEVFRTKEQLVRCCLEDLVMGKLHGLTIGLDICTTLHMDVTLDDLDWCIDQIMPANPAYFMALPTKNDPMLSYLTTSFSDHIRVREQFGYKVNEPMWEFFKRINIIDSHNQPTVHFGQPTQVYLRYCRAKGDIRNDESILQEGKSAIARVRQRGVPIAEGFGEKTWHVQPSLEQEIRELYADAKYCLWTEWEESFAQQFKHSSWIDSMSKNRIDYVYHPTSGERLSLKGLAILRNLRKNFKNHIPEVQIVISDGLNARSLMDEGHLESFLPQLNAELNSLSLSIAEPLVFIRNGRVRAGYEVGEMLFGNKGSKLYCLVHIIGERPGTIHRNFSVYITAASASTWKVRGKVDHDITRVVSGISDTAYSPNVAAAEVASIIGEIMSKK
jgi:ethanolamine ammonia-lyase large subunit